MGVQLDQLIDDIARSKIGSIAGEKISNQMTLINDKFGSPLDVSLSGTVLTVGAGKKQTLQSDGLGSTENSYKWRLPIISGIELNPAISTLDFADGNTTGDFGDDPVVCPSLTASYYVQMGVELRADGKLYAVFGTEAATSGATTPPTFTDGSFQIMTIMLKDDGTSGSWNLIAPVESDIEIVKMSSSGAGGSGTGGGGGELADLLYNARMEDKLDEIPSLTLPVDIGTAKTDESLYSAAKKYYRLGYDASKTLTGTGTAMALSANITQFTPKAGDVLIFGNEAKKITTWTSYSNFVIESAFVSNPSASACCISQAVHTVDLNAYTNNGQEVSAASQFTANVTEAMIMAEDSETDGDVVPDWGSAAKIAFSVSANGSSWSDKASRTQYISDTMVSVNAPIASTNLYVRFFANKTSGSGQVNLLGYKVFWHKDEGALAGETYFTAFARIDSADYSNCSHSVVGGKSRFTFTSAYPLGLSPSDPSGSALEIYADGKLVPRHDATLVDLTGAYFKEIDGYTIEMDTDYSVAGIDFQFKVPRLVIDTNTQNTTRLTAVESYLQEGLQDFVIQDMIDVPYTTIVNRSKMPNLANDLLPRMGNNRLSIDSSYIVQDEVGINGESVYGITGDRFNQVRLVGVWTFINNSYGKRVYTNNADITSYAEITFYGTGLNITTGTTGGTRDWRVMVDGVSVGGNISPVNSNILSGRNYAPNILVQVVSGLSLGLHTVTIRDNNASDDLNISGFEIINESATIKVPTGLAFVDRKPVAHSTLDSINYNSGFESGILGTRGGRVLAYLKSDGTIGKAITPTNASAAYLTNANHSNEEIARRINHKEFGAGRSDDFSTINGIATDRAFTLSDGVTTLTGDNVIYTVNEGIGFTPNGAFTLTFVGTGLDFIGETGNAGTFGDIYIDGSSVGSGVINRGIVRNKVCSGLPYGTHTVRYHYGAGSAMSGVTEFIIYQPKTPVLPVGAIKIGSYNIIADYIANSVVSSLAVSTGVLRKQISQREAVYAGTESVGMDVTAYIGGWLLNMSASASYMEYVFYGTGFELRNRCNVANSTSNNILINGVVPVGLTVASYGGYSHSYTGGSNLSFSQAGLTDNGCGLRVSGLALGVHKVRVTTNTALGCALEAFDIITPIHSHESLSPMSMQELPVGSQGICDIRSLNAEAQDLYNYSKVMSIHSAALTTTSTSQVPLPTMNKTHYSKTGKIRVHYSWIGAGDRRTYCYIDGVNHASLNSYNSNESVHTQTDVIEVGVGAHNVMLTWLATSGTAYFYGSGNFVLGKIIIEDVQK